MNQYQKDYIDRLPLAHREFAEDVAAGRVRIAGPVNWDNPSSSISERTVIQGCILRIAEFDDEKGTK